MAIKKICGGISARAKYCLKTVYDSFTAVLSSPKPFLDQ